ncbi:MAG: hypothetical protein NWE92_08745 [Candidatus Bathyarchaeota archaeon]|nr:hypothetical protein [Candidatus Bathyarchaeota archaeon]
MSQWGSEGSGTGQFSHPTGVAVDSSGNVYVADSGNSRIQKFTSDGTYISQWGSKGTGTNQFDRPIGVAVDSSGNVYVADSISNVYKGSASNLRIEKFTNTGTYITQWGPKVSGSDDFSFTNAVAVDSAGYVYVSDLFRSSVYKFTGDGTFITRWGEYGSKNGQFNGNVGVAVDAFGYVYVTDTDNSRVQKFSPSTTMQATASNGATVDIKITGTVDSSQMSNIKITTNQATKTTTLSFTVTGQSGTTGFGIITIPKSAVAYGTTPVVSIDGAKIKTQFYTVDTDNYYVWYNTNFSTHTITMEFTADAPTQSSLATNIIVACAVIILAVLVIGVFMKRRNREITKNWIKH